MDNEGGGVESETSGPNITGRCLMAILFFILLDLCENLLFKK